MSTVHAVPRFDFFASRSFGGHGSYYGGAMQGDFDRDGKLDIVTTSSSAIFVYFGDATSGFSGEPLTLYSGNESFVYPYAGDFNGDGYTDVALKRPQPQTSPTSIAVYLGRADRTFSQPIFTSFSELPYYFSVADIDSDGIDDLLGTVAVPGSSHLAVFRGNGGGGFHLPVSIVSNAGGWEAIAAGDLDNDNDIDIAYSRSYPDGLVVVRNLGDGNFAAPVLLGSIVYGFAGLAIGDFNNDGINDIAASQDFVNGPDIAIWLGSTNFTFTSAGYVSLDVPRQGYIQRVVDLDLDGNQDLTFVTQNRTVVKWGTGTGTFPNQSVFYDAGGHYVIAADVNSDGLPDLTAPQSVEVPALGSGSLVSIMNLGGRNFRTAPTIQLSRGTKDIEVGHLNSDQLKDFVVINRGSGNTPGEVYVFFQSSSNGFSTDSTDNGMFVGSMIITANDVVIGNFAGSSLNDIIVVGEGTNGAVQNATLMTNLGSNNFSISHFILTGDEIRGVATADLNNDGKLDLVTSRDRGIQISYGNGNGTFATPVFHDLGAGVGTIAVADVNNDGAKDIALEAYTLGPRILVLVNSGAGTFGAPVTMNGCYGLSDIELAHVGGGSSVDIVASCEYGISVYKGNGDATFEPGLLYPMTPDGTQDLSVGDLDGDGDMDAAVVIGRNSVITFQNMGSGVFLEDSMWSGGGESVVAAAADLNGDTKAEILVGYTDNYHGFLKLLFNNSPEVAPTSKAPFDFDGDGRTDVSSFKPGPGEWWYLRSSDGGNRAFQFGLGTDVLVPADYTGDGKTDNAFYRNGEWFIQRSTDFSFYSFPFGTATDIPVPADYDGDGKADAAVFRASTGEWFIQRSSDGQVTVTGFGNSTDRPVPADIDGDGKADIAIFRPLGQSGMGEWWYLRSSDGGNRAFAFGQSTDKTVVGDYTGDGKADFAFFRPSNGTWYVLRSEDSSFYSFPFGNSSDVPAPGDYDGDGKFDAAVFRPSDTNWYIQRSTAGTLIQQFGAPSDKPVPGVYVR